MFCIKCGFNLEDSARFCSNCGYDSKNQTENETKKSDNHLKFKLKPKYDILYKFLDNLWKMSLYGIIIWSIFIDSYEFISLKYSMTLFVLLIIIVICLVLKMIFEKIQYDNLEYNFYQSKVEYKDGFFNKEEKELKYKYIREVTMSQNVLERFCGIGTIKIFTNASSALNNRTSRHSMKSRNGIYIHCVNNVEKQYKIIKKIIDEGTRYE